jgi:hypothetical protein
MKPVTDTAPEQPTNLDPAQAPHQPTDASALDTWPTLAGPAVRPQSAGPVSDSPAGSDVDAPPDTYDSGADVARAGAVNQPAGEPVTGPAEDTGIATESPPGDSRSIAEPTPVPAPDRSADPLPLWPTTGSGPTMRPQPERGSTGTAVATVVRPAPARPAGQPRASRPTRRPVIGLPAVVLLGLVSAFFAWVTAEPLWLAVGHAEPGTVTVARCAGDGLARRCVGSFTSADRRFSAAVPVVGGSPGAAVPARMTSSRGTRAYAGTGHALRAILGVGLLLLCGAGIVWATGALRLAGRRARVTAAAVGVTAPLLLFAGMLAATW